MVISPLLVRNYSVISVTVPLTRFYSAPIQRLARSDSSNVEFHDRKCHLPNMAIQPNSPQMFTALAAVVQYIIAGRIVLDYGVYFAAVGVLSSVLGQSTLTWFIRKYKKQSLLVFITAGIISASTVLLFISGLQTIITQYQAGVSMGFHGLC